MLAGILGVDTHNAGERVDAAVLQVVAAGLHKPGHHLRRCPPH